MEEEKDVLHEDINDLVQNKVVQLEKVKRLDLRRNTPTIISLLAERLGNEVLLNKSSSNTRRKGRRLCKKQEKTPLQVFFLVF